MFKYTLCKEYGDILCLKRDGRLMSCAYDSGYCTDTCPHYDIINHISTGAKTAVITCSPHIKEFVIQDD